MVWSSTSYEQHCCGKPADAPNMTIALLMSHLPNTTTASAISGSAIFDEAIQYYGGTGNVIQGDI